MSTTTAQTPIINWAPPYFPSLPLQMMPQRLLDGLINNYGVTLAWAKSHECPCAWGHEIPGSPDPNCSTCNGRGYFWDDYFCAFQGLITFMHTASAPDEPGTVMDHVHGQIERAEPTLSIPYSASDVWQGASTMDAFVEINAASRLNTVLVQGENNVLPYQKFATVQTVYAYNPEYQNTYPLQPSQWNYASGCVTLNGFPDGTAYTVEYTAAPVYLAWRSAGGMAHTRPFAAGTGQIPKRFRLVSLDVWTRARNSGQSIGGQGFALGIGGNNGIAIGTGGEAGTTSTSPQAL